MICENFGNISLIEIKYGLLFYRTIIAAQRDDSHQSNCNRLRSGFNSVATDLVGNEMFALQVMRQLRHQNTRVLVE